MSRRPLLFIGGLMVWWVIMTAYNVFVFDRERDWDEFSCANDLYSAFYLTLITLTTVGYGDVVPCSAPARLLVVLGIIMGLLLTAVMVAVVTSIMQPDPVQTQVLAFIKERQSLDLYRQLAGRCIAEVFRYAKYKRLKDPFREVTSWYRLNDMLNELRDRRRQFLHARRTGAHRQRDFVHMLKHQKQQFEKITTIVNNLGDDVQALGRLFLAKSNTHPYLPLLPMTPNIGTGSDDCLTNREVYDPSLNPFVTSTPLQLQRTNSTANTASPRINLTLTTPLPLPLPLPIPLPGPLSAPAPVSATTPSSANITSTNNSSVNSSSTVPVVSPLLLHKTAAPASSAPNSASIKHDFYSTFDSTDSACVCDLDCNSTTGLALASTLDTMVQRLDLCETKMVGLEEQQEQLLQQEDEILGHIQKVTEIVRQFNRAVIENSRHAPPSRGGRSNARTDWIPHPNSVPPSPPDDSADDDSDDSSRRSFLFV